MIHFKQIIATIATMQINATVGGWVVVHDDDDDDVHTHSMSNCAQNAVCEYIIIFIVFKICSSDLFFGVESWTMRMLLVCYLLYKACYVCLLECLLDLNWCKKHQQRIEWLRKVSTRSIREMVWRIRQSVICSHVSMMVMVMVIAVFSYFFLMLHVKLWKFVCFIEK